MVSRVAGTCGVATAVLALLAVSAPRVSGQGPAAAADLRVGVARLPATSDPAMATGGPEAMVFGHVYQGLVQFGERGDLEPGLASRWSVSRDGLVWTFRLRSDVRFHDGTVLGPDIAVTALARHLTPQDPVASPVDETGLPPTWARVFPGTEGLVREVRRGAPGTIEIQLHRPFSPLLGLLAHPALAIVLTRSDSEVPILGTGPYRVAERGFGRITLEATAPGPSDQPRPTRIYVYEVGDDATGVAELGLGGLIDVFFPQAPPAWAGLGLQVVSAPTWHTGFLALRSGEGLLARKVVRQAVALALDPALLTPALGRWATPYDGFLPPGAWAARPAALPVHDAARARRLLGEAGVTSPTLTLLAPEAGSGPDLVRVAEAVRLSLAVAGVEVAVRAESGEAYAQALRTGEADLALVEAALEVNDPHFVLQPLVATEAARRGHATNVAFYQSPLVSGMLSRAGQLAYRPERLRLYQRLQAHLADELPYVPLYVRLQWALARREVRGLRLDPAGLHRLDRVWVEVRPAPAPPPDPRPAPDARALPGDGATQVGP